MNETLRITSNLFYYYLLIFKSTKYVLKIQQYIYKTGAHYVVYLKIQSVG